MTKDHLPSLRVVLGDDHPLMREGLRRSLEAFGVTVVAEVGNGREAVAAVEAHHPELAVLDLWMPVMDGVRAAEIITARHPYTKVAMVTFDTSEAEHERALVAGAAAVLTKDLEAAVMVDRLQAVANGEIGSLPPRERGDVDDELSLSSRELEVLQLIVAGAATGTIAETLFISAKTVKNHLASIYEKLDVGDRTQAVLVALRLGLVSLDRRDAGNLAAAG